MKSQCPLLKRYNYPFHLSQTEISDWYLELCNVCPAKREGHCFDDWQEIREELWRFRVPCPKCGAKDSWINKSDGGIDCIHCGYVIYWTTPLKRTWKTNPV